MQFTNTARVWDSYRVAGWISAAFAGLFLLLLISTPATVEAKEFERPIKIGVLSPYWGNSPQVIGLTRGLEELGYRENRDYVVGVRFTSGSLDALPQAVRDLAGMGADLIFSESIYGSLGAKKINPAIPQIFNGSVDPVSFGLVRSFARPGENSTGVTVLMETITPKILEAITWFLPGKKRVLYMGYNLSQMPEQERFNRQLKEILERTARRLGIDLDMRFVSSQEEAKRVLRGVRRGKADGIVCPAIYFNLFGYSLEASRRERIPLMTQVLLTVEQGALASYGPNYEEMGRQSARLMDKIIRGEKPGNIPVEVMDQMKFAINLKVARELGIKIPREVLYRADRIIR